MREDQKTSLGMKAYVPLGQGPGGGPPPPVPGPMASPDQDQRMQVLGAAVTVGVHFLVVAIVVGMNFADRGHVEKAAAKEYTSIEAGLAIKSKSTSGQKTKLPVKDVAPKVKPPTVAATKDANAKPSKPDPKDPPPPDSVDDKSVMDKYRKMEDKGDPTPTDNGKTDEQNQKGSANGSEFGTLEQAKGDEYVGELIGRMTKDFTAPKTVTGQVEAWGCVKLDETGKIVDRAIDPEHKSKSYAFNSAVEEQLKNATDMTRAVPDHLKHMLIGKFVCATYRTE